MYFARIYRVCCFSVGTKSQRCLMLLFRKKSYCCYCCSTVFNVIQHCSGQMLAQIMGLGLKFCQRRLLATPKIEKETVQFGHCLHRQTYGVVIDSIRQNMGLSVGQFPVKYNQRSFLAPKWSEFGYFGGPSHSEVTVSVIVQPKSLTLSLLLFTEPHCCLLLLFNNNNKNFP